MAGTGAVVVLLVHGYASSKDYFDETLSRLNLQGLRIVSVDLPGHGASAAVDDYSAEHLARELICVLDEVGATRFVAVAHSMGAKVVQQFRRLVPDTLLGLVLIAGAPASAIPISDSDFESWIGGSREPEAIRAAYAAITSVPISESVLERCVRQAGQMDPKVLRATLTTCFREDFAQALRTSRSCPTLLIGGALDPVFPPALLDQDLLETNLGARLVLLPCGHEVPNELPETTALLLEGFLAGCLPGTHD